MKIFSLVMVAIVVLVTLLANFGLAGGAFAYLKFVPGGDLTAHFALYGFLALALVSWASRTRLAPTRPVRAYTTAALVVLVTLEEWSQSLFPARTSSLLDLLMSLMGILAGAIASTILFGHRRSERRRHSVGPIQGEN